MGKDSNIEWTDHTFNPWWGCVKVSDECDHCYAERDAVRYGFSESGSHFPIWGKDAGRRFFGDQHWHQPLKWDRAAGKAGERHRVFCASYADVMEDRPDLIESREHLRRVVMVTEHLDWLMLTKRPQNFDKLWPGPRGFNFWAGTTVGVKKSLWRIDELRKVEAAVRFLSIEPLLEDLGPLDLTGIGWVIVGGESGPGARPMRIEWVESIIRQCHAAGVNCFVKQLGACPIWAGAVCSPIAPARGKCGDPGEWPESLRVREIPNAR